MVNWRRITLACLMMFLVLTLAGCELMAEAPAQPAQNGQSEKQWADGGKDQDSDQVSDQYTDQNQDSNPDQNTGQTEADRIRVKEGQSYSGMEEVAAYLHLYGTLPPNFITKSEAREMGWQSDEGNLWQVTDRKSIGGDRFGNREGLLPEKDGRTYYECDVNYQGGFRGGERIVYSNDGLIFYSDDHYSSFTQLY